MALQYWHISNYSEFEVFISCFTQSGCDELQKALTDSQM